MRQIKAYIDVTVDCPGKSADSVLRENLHQELKEMFPGYNLTGVFQKGIRAILICSSKTVEAIIKQKLTYRCFVIGWLDTGLGHSL